MVDTNFPLKGFDELTYLKLNPDVFKAVGIITALMASVKIFLVFPLKCAQHFKTGLSFQKNQYLPNICGREFMGMRIFRPSRI
jgi:hypothetical protein